MKELIDALGVVANPNASEEEKAAALEKLTAYFNAQLDSQESTATTEATSEASDKSDEKEKASEASDAGAGKDEPAKDEPSKEMASAAATIKGLVERVAKLEKASSLGNAPRAQKPTILQRQTDAAAVVNDPVLKMISEAAANTRRNASK